MNRPARDGLGGMREMLRIAPRKRRVSTRIEPFMVPARHYFEAIEGRPDDVRCRLCGHFAAEHKRRKGDA